MDQWTSGPLVQCLQWLIDPMVHFRTGPLAHWSLGPMVHYEALGSNRLRIP